MSIYDRIINTMRARGRLESERQFCSNLGLSPTYLSQLRDRCLKDPASTIASHTAAKIARELGLEVDELLGMTSPRQEGDPYPSRADAVTAARALQFSQRAIDAAYREDPGVDPGRLWWFRRIEAEESRLSVIPTPRALRLEAERASRSDRPRKR